MTVNLREARNLAVWGFPWQSNPYCRLTLGDQAMVSRREGDTSMRGSHKAPMWNQEFQFLVEDPMVQVRSGEGGGGGSGGIRGITTRVPCHQEGGRGMRSNSWSETPWCRWGRGRRRE